MYKVKALKTFQDRSKKMIPIGKVFNTDDAYAKKLVDWKLVEVINIIQEKAKVIYKKKIVEPEKNKEEIKEQEHEGYDEEIEEIKVEPGEVGILEESTGKKERKKIIEPITTDQFKIKKRRKKIIKRSKW